MEEVEEDQEAKTELKEMEVGNQELKQTDTVIKMKEVLKTKMNL